MEAFIRLFLSCDANAKEVEEITDNIIDEMDEAQKKKKKESERKQREEALEDTINDRQYFSSVDGRNFYLANLISPLLFIIFPFLYFSVVAKAGKHMEETIIGANIALLLSHCIWDNKVRISVLL